MSDTETFLIILIVMAIIGGVIVNNLDVSKWKNKHLHE
jgi:hypothetical protein